jgi:mannose-6-phosphate isomerase-like protein (cupin superfamily)
MPGRVKVIDPATIEPTNYHHHALRTPGTMEHRRVISQWADGVMQMDAGLNRYLAGTRFVDIGYNHDEICYSLSGPNAGLFSFRFQGSTSSSDMNVETSSLCFFAPPRPFGWEATPLPEPKRRGPPKRIAAADIAPVYGDPFLLAGTVETRHVVTLVDDGPTRMSASVKKYSAGARLRDVSYPQDEILYILKGSATLIMDGERVAATQGMFVYRPAGERNDFECAEETEMISVRSPPAN